MLRFESNDVPHVLQFFLKLLFTRHIRSALACLDIFPNIDRIRKVNCPVFIIHGELDEEVDISHGKALYNAVPEDCRYTPWWVPDRGHNDITEGRSKVKEYLEKMKAFIQCLNDNDGDVE